MRNPSLPPQLIQLIAAVGSIMILAAVFAPRASAQRREVAQRGMGVINDVHVARRVDEMKKQLEGQLEGQLAVELGFIRRTCQPTAEQKEQVVAVAKEYLGTFAEANQRVRLERRAGGLIVRNGQIYGAMGPQMRERLKQKLWSILTKDQWDRYMKEYEQREAFRKNLIFDQIMARYEERLSLDLDQRKKIRRSLESSWMMGSHVSLEALDSNSQYLPSLPDVYIVPFLEEDQTAIYRAAPKLPLAGSPDRREPVLFQEDFWGFPE